MSSTPIAVEHTFAYAPFRRLLVARVVSGVGSYMQVVAAGWLVFQLTGSAMAVGILGFLALGPSLVGSPIGGWLADRFCPRKLATALSALSAIGPGAMAVMAFAGGLDVAEIYVFTLLGAIPHAIALPVKSIVTPYSVPAALRRKAVSDISAANGISELVGSLAGGVVVQFAGPGWAFAVNALSEVVNALLFHFSPVLQESCDRARAARSGGLWQGFIQGWAFDIVRVALVGATTFFALIGPLQSLMPKLASYHQDDPMLLGALLAAISVGALIANRFVRRRLADSRSAAGALVNGLLISAAASLLLAASPTFPTDLMCLVLVGVGWETVFVAGAASIQLDVPAEISGRMVGVFFLCVAGAVAVGSVAIGWLFDTVGVDWSLAGIGLLGILVGVVLRRHQRRAHFLAPQSTLMDMS